jgi:hypothetical protein
VTKGNAVLVAALCVGRTAGVPAPETGKPVPVEPDEQPESQLEAP